MDKRVYLCLAHMSGREQDFIREAFDTNWVVPLGPNVNAFEEELGAFLGGGKRVVALSAGTAAIHLGLVLLGIGPGDEVICQSFTFCASANPAVYLGATPVFVDSEPRSWNMDPELLEEAIRDRIARRGRKPKAIIPVHLYGMRPISTPSAAWPNGMESRCWRMPPRPLARSSRGASAARSGHWGRCRSTATR